MNGGAPRGKVIVLVGPDGAGKSTIARIMREALDKNYATLHIHHRPRRIPSRSGSMTDVTQPHSQPTYAWPLSLMKLLVLFADFAVGHIHARRFADGGGWVIWERGWWDLDADPRRYRLKRHPRLVRLLGRCLTRPDNIVLLDAPPALIHSRKSELSLQEISEQQGRWARLSEQLPVHRIDASQSVQELTEQVWGLLGQG